MEVSCFMEVLGEEYVLRHVKWKYGLSKKVYMENKNIVED
jgi:hypothetical protein